MKVARSFWRGIACLLVVGGCRAVLDIEPPDEVAAASCLRNSDCKLGEKCLFRVCGAQCEKDLDCSDGQRCVNSAGMKACVTNATASCASVSCPSGLVCVEGTCRTMCADSTACSQDQICFTGACFGTSAKHDSSNGGASGAAGKGSGGTTSLSSGGTTSLEAGNAGAGPVTSGGSSVGQGGSSVVSPPGEGGAGGAIGGSGGEAGSDVAGGASGAGGAPECAPGDVSCDVLTPLSCQAGFYHPAGAACAYACAKGACTGECVNGKTQCKGVVFQRCVANIWQTVQTCTSVCSESQGCVGSCTPGNFQCNGTRDLDKCSAQGVYVHDSTCPYACKGGACTGSCLPGTKDCMNLVARSCGEDASYSMETCAHECAGGVCIGCTSGDSKCPAGCSWPADGDCLRQRGDACTLGTQCVSTACAGGVCCDKACTGPCESCTRSGNVGTCTLPNYQTDNANCGACGNACTGGRSCVKGACVCPTGQTYCAALGACVDTSSDANNCGGCGIVCSSSHVSASCSGGVCNGACATGYLDCNVNKRSDGCEVNSNIDGGNCGSCGNACPYKVCQAGSCVASRWGLSGDSASDANFNANVMWGVRITIAQAGKVAALGVRTVTGGVHVRLALYSNSGSSPFALVAETGAVTSVANGATEGSIDAVSVAAGDYWVFMVSDATVRIDVESATTSWWYANRTYGAFPSTPPALTSLSYSWGHLYAVTTP